MPVEKAKGGKILSSTKSGEIISTLPRQSSLSLPSFSTFHLASVKTMGLVRGEMHLQRAGRGSRVGSTCRLLADELELSSHRRIPYRRAASLPFTMTTLPSGEIRDGASARMPIRGE
ncbi:hypothetical protein MAPG_08582 [Magnaporthiopsis poae ATCC 64411]|uniref:Uncharacterized protein n=1 Tax=Magnaporthiopsis poae (strain ATCC 64411 / 73-15) TaxID=644358 RepID=A0A0C4E7R2_MAGP6|nr:hypothetical protein MAPG_08582 [Magnaporthiopsis poae ATCC 64411]